LNRPAENIIEKTFVRSGVLLQKKFYSYLVPTVIMNLALSLGVVVDGIIVGNILGTDAFSAVNICAPVLYFFSALYALFGVGGSTIAARMKGAMDNHSANKVFTLSIAGLILSSCLIGFLCFIFSDPISGLLSGKSRLQELVKTYFTILSLGIPFLVTISGAVYFIRTDSRPKLAANILILANAFNLTFDLIFMGFFKMGIEGAGLATVLGYILGGVLGIKYFASNTRTFKFVQIKKSDLKLFSSILGTGLPSALAGATVFVKNFAINIILLKTLGPGGVAMFAVCLNTLAVSGIIIGGTAQTLVPVLGCTYGEKDFQGIRLIMKVAVLTVTGLCIFMVLLFTAFPGKIAWIFGIDAAHLMAPLTFAIRIFSLSLPFFGLNFVMICYFQTIDRKLFSSMIVILENLVYILPLILFMETLFGEPGIWISFIMAEIFTLGTVFFVSFMIRKKSGKNLSPFLLLEDIDAKMLDVTIHSSIENATGISDDIIRFCKKNNISPERANRAGLIAEELTTNIIRFGKTRNSDSLIDIRLSIAQDDIVLRIRDDGIPFNPVEHIRKKGLESSFGLKIVNQMAKKFDYTYALNFNNTAVSL
jgi:Na+-driven multidrug efflux pump/anti-sigma regulatory factor (Ser/Thr protein kinase)